MKFYVADFETTGKDFLDKHGYTKVWLYSVCDNEANIVNRGASIEQFMQFAVKARATIYFHNLKFDGSFIMDWLLRQGWQWKEKLKDEPRTFTTLIGDMGEFYSLTMQATKTHRVKIADSLKVIPISVKEIARKFDLPIMKETIDYHDYRIDADRIRYVDHDVRIVAMALNKVKGEGISRMTLASSAYTYFRKDIPKERYAMMFPDLGEKWLTEWRNAYRGGRAQVNPEYARQVVTDLIRYDVNSMYPSIMRNMPLPYGMPWKIDKPGDYKFAMYHIKADFVLKIGCIPSLLDKRANGFLNDGTNYYIESDGMEELWLSSIDYELMKRNYAIREMEFIEGWAFQTNTWMFKDYVDHWYRIKKTEKGAMHEIAKLMLNSLYGKFGSNVWKKSKIPRLDDDGIVRFDFSDPVEGAHYYLPLAVAITSYGHKIIDDAIHAVGYENFIYTDTDSIHTTAHLPDDMVSQTDLGKFKIEAYEQEGKYIRPKTYITKTDGEWSITCAGLPQEAKEELIRTYGDRLKEVFDSGLTAQGKLMPKRVPGGVILNECTFKIK